MVFWTQNEPKMTMRRVFSFSKKHRTTNPRDPFWVQFEIVLRKDHSPCYPRSPRIGKDLVTSWVGFSQKTRPYFWKWGTFSGVKMGELLVAPESYLLPLLPFYLWDFLYMISFYSLTSILEFTSETSERERKLVYYLTPLQKQECVMLEHTIYLQRGGGPSINGPLSLFFLCFYILLFFLDFLYFIVFFVFFIF